MDDKTPFPYIESTSCVALSQTGVQKGMRLCGESCQQADDGSNEQHKMPQALIPRLPKHCPPVALAKSMLVAQQGIAIKPGC